MAAFTFSIGNSINASAEIDEVSTDKLYGYTEDVTLDLCGNPLQERILGQNNKLYRKSQITNARLVDNRFTLEKPSILDRQTGALAASHPSSLKNNELFSECNPLEILDIHVEKTYQLTTNIPDSEKAKTFRGKFNYKQSSQSNTAFITWSNDSWFMLIGKPHQAHNITLENNSQIITEETEETDDGFNSLI